MVGVSRLVPLHYASLEHLWKCRSPPQSFTPVPFRGRVGSTCVEIGESLGTDELLSTCARLDA